MVSSGRPKDSATVSEIKEKIQVLEVTLHDGEAYILKSLCHEFTPDFKDIHISY